MSFRIFDKARDRDAVHRIWHECGWIEPDSEKQAEGLDVFLSRGRLHLADLDGAAECMALTVPATLRHLDQDLSLACVAAVLTSRVARKQNLASRLTARAIAADAAEGALVETLGIFEQGFYNRLGFGNGSYEPRMAFDPATLRTGVRARAPKRLSAADAQRMHENRLTCRRLHGAVTLTDVEGTLGEVKLSRNPIGLGYEDRDGRLTHHIWMEAKDVEEGPYHVLWMAYSTREELLELLSILYGFGDQVRSVSMNEPPSIQLQDILAQPFRYRALSQRSRFEAWSRTSAYWQMRINDVPGCLAQTHLVGKPVRFNLKLDDPIVPHLDDDAAWRGVSGEYVVTLAEESAARAGTDPALPTLSASVNAFTRLWLGVRPATGLAVTDDVEGPPELLDALDRVLRLPPPRTHWNF